jgi:hypothetical protein
MNQPTERDDDRRLLPVKRRPKPQTLLEASDDYTDAVLDLGHVIRRDLVNPLLRWADRHRVLFVFIVAGWVGVIIIMVAVFGGPSQVWAP